MGRSTADSLAIAELPELNHSTPKGFASDAVTNIVANGQPIGSYVAGEMRDRVIGERTEQAVIIPEAGDGIVHPTEALAQAAPAAAAGNQYGMDYRTYDERSSNVRPSVSENYRANHINQTYEFVCSMHERYSGFDKRELGVWEAIELLNSIVDDSDPDTALPQVQHLLQTAEAARKAYPEDDWLHLTALIHDLGKVLAHPDFGSQPQWAVVGDTFPTGCAHDPSIIFHPFFEANPDSRDERYSSKLGIYEPNCGLKNVKMSWGHDEYLYKVLMHNGCKIPAEGLFMIRYHSFYALHQSGAYGHLLDEEDRAMLPWLKRFQKCDLYSKTAEPQDVEQLKPYYMGLIHKYFPSYVLKW